MRTDHAFSCMIEGISNMLRKCNSKTLRIENDKRNNDYPEGFFHLTLCLIFFSISVHVGLATASPVAISANPVNGATGVSQTADLVSITFNKPMNTAYRSVSTSNWSSSFFTNYWSEDGKTLYLPRQDVHYPFVPHTKVMIMINLPGYENIRDTEGNFAEEYNLTFWIQIYQLSKNCRTTGKRLPLALIYSTFQKLPEVPPCCWSNRTIRVSRLMTLLFMREGQSHFSIYGPHLPMY